jgi:hypothetical protein
MKSGNGSRELTRIATAYVASLAFGVTFLVATLAGVEGSTALLRSVTAAALALVGGWLLMAPLIDTVLTALARDEAKRRAQAATEDDA